MDITSNMINISINQLATLPSESFEGLSSEHLLQTHFGGVMGLGGPGGPGGPGLVGLIRLNRNSLIELQ